MNSDFTEQENDESNPENFGGKWLMIAPIEGVRLTEASKFEFRIHRISLVAGHKLPRICKRLGIAKPLTQLDSISKSMLNGAEVFAILSESGVPENHKQSWLHIIEEELDLLSSSQLGFARRGINGSYGVPRTSDGKTHSYAKYILINTKDFTRSMNWHPKGTAKELVINENWLSFHKSSFFHKLLKILRGETTVHKMWKEALYRASLLIGQGQSATDITYSFMWNFTALDTLLGGERSGKYYEVLQIRVAALLGLTEKWEKDFYDYKVKDIYEKRSNFIHQGKYADITLDDLKFIESLLENLLISIVSYPKIFNLYGSNSPRLCLEIAGEGA